MRLLCERSRSIEFGNIYYIIIYISLSPCLFLLLSIPRLVCGFFPFVFVVRFTFQLKLRIAPLIYHDLFYTLLTAVFLCASVLPYPISTNFPTRLYGRSTHFVFFSNSSIVIIFPIFCFVSIPRLLFSRSRSFLTFFYNTITFRCVHALFSDSRSYLRIIDILFVTFFRFLVSLLKHKENIRKMSIKL